eukprot:4283199-Alexandrium_andersonii.AAC.1
MGSCRASKVGRGRSPRALVVGIPMAVGYFNGCRACRSENMRNGSMCLKLELHAPTNDLNQNWSPMLWR